MINPIRIENIEAIKVYSVRHIGDYSKIGTAFEKLMQWAYKNKIKNKKNLMGKDAFSYGIAYDNPHIIDVEKLRSDACINNTDDTVEIEDGIYKQNILGGKYAVFLHIGEYSKLKETYEKIFSTSFIQNESRLQDAPLFEKYLNRDPRKTKPQNLKTEIFIPIK